MEITCGRKTLLEESGWILHPPLLRTFVWLWWPFCSQWSTLCLSSTSSFCHFNRTPCQLTKYILFQLYGRPRTRILFKRNRILILHHIHRLHVKRTNKEKKSSEARSNWVQCSNDNFICTPSCHVFIGSAWSTCPCFPNSALINKEEKLSVFPIENNHPHYWRKYQH